ncbi:MAG TPA: hypothetical protein DCW74_15015 [Alteromonas australica]|uniref:Uncharacterized protein n=1 Tax=Alteromonas australica TaxID=589873 RepID=A0A075P429_9ALTE|nr:MULTISPECIES: hypothetical protein [Alteromonas]MAB91901.1 hypothetical protein [Alteromonas sp.]AIF98057.1 hypothetical protein EP13_04720 [Alteromonas australica]MAO29609.1 hypothetical protein [Alteromonas sp.]MBU32537.1 hypothetical protein [Alteromonas sp.]QPL49206.1 hypothetical protein IUA53_15360 [Alteromonas sp. B31-7]|tara:strand:+ start:122 stop:598 length:477 start_codon:yes stop_codon:yes gene_type:complete
MKVSHLLCTLLGLIAVSGCSTMSTQAKQEDSQFRFENFEQDKAFNNDYAYLMCFRQRPTEWQPARHYDSGEHNLWVRAVSYERRLPSTEREALVNFKLELDAGKDYRINREINDGIVKVWIEEKDSSEIISEVKTAELKRPINAQLTRDLSLCQESTV